MRFNRSLVNVGPAFGSYSETKRLNYMQPFINGIQTVLYKKLNINPKLIHAKTDFRKDLQLCDWEMIYLLNAVEQNWNIEISDIDALKINNLQQLMRVIKKAYSKN